MELQIENLSKRYPNGTQALQNVSLNVPQGMFGLLAERSRQMENDLKKVTPPEFEYLYDDWFDNITLFDNRVVSASYSQLPDGKYRVRISVEAKKYRADGKGQEHQIRHMISSTSYWMPTATSCICKSTRSNRSSKNSR